MLNAKRYIDQRVVLKISSISCLALIFNLNNPRTTVRVLYAKKLVAGGGIQEVIYRFFQLSLIRTYGLVVEASRSESGDLGSIPDEC